MKGMAKMCFIVFDEFIFLNWVKLEAENEFWLEFFLPWCNPCPTTSEAFPQAPHYEEKWGTHRESLKAMKL